MNRQRTIIPLLKRVTQCESCRYVFQRNDHCFEERKADWSIYIRRCPKCGARVIFHAADLPKLEEEKTK